MTRPRSDHRLILASLAGLVVIAVGVWRSSTAEAQGTIGPIPAAKRPDPLNMAYFFQPPSP